MMYSLILSIACCLAEHCGPEDQAKAATEAQNFCNIAGVTGLPTAVTCSSTASITSASSSTATSTSSSSSKSLIEAAASPTQTQSQAAVAFNTSSSGLSTGAKAGVGVGAVIGTGIFAVLVYIAVLMRKRQQANAPPLVTGQSGQGVPYTELGQGLPHEMATQERRVEMGVYNAGEEKSLK